MLRLSEYLKAGGLLVAGDKCHNTKNEEDNEFDCVIADGLDFAGHYRFTGDGYGIYDDDDIKEVAITSFAPRKNTGVQPALDDFPVLVEWDDGVDEKTEAMYVTWDDKNVRGNIDSWKPDLEELIKQQKKPIEEIMINAKESKMSEFRYGQKIYIKDNTEHDFTFGCYHTDGESILFMFDGGYGKADIDDAKATPFKTELEIAKEKQIDLIHEKSIAKGYHVNVRYLKFLQEEEHLAGITLPRED